MIDMLNVVKEKLELSPDLRKKILIVLGLLLVFRFGSYIPVPGINRELLKEVMNSGANGIFGMINIISGGAFEQISIFAMSITPYITSSIINILTISNISTIIVNTIIY